MESSHSSNRFSEVAGASSVLFSTYRSCWVLSLPSQKYLPVLCDKQPLFGPDETSNDSMLVSGNSHFLDVCSTLWHLHTPLKTRAAKTVTKRPDRGASNKSSRISWIFFFSPPSPCWPSRGWERCCERPSPFPLLTSRISLKDRRSRKVTEFHYVLPKS